MTNKQLAEISALIADDKTCDIVITFLKDKLNELERRQMQAKAIDDIELTPFAFPDFETFKNERSSFVISLGLFRLEWYVQYSGIVVRFAEKPRINNDTKIYECSHFELNEDGFKKSCECIVDYRTVMLEQLKTAKLKQLNVGGDE